VTRSEVPFNTFRRPRTLTPPIPTHYPLLQGRNAGIFPQDYMAYKHRIFTTVTISNLRQLWSFLHIFSNDAFLCQDWQDNRNYHYSGRNIWTPYIKHTTPLYCWCGHDNNRTDGCCQSKQHWIVSRDYRGGGGGNVVISWWATHNSSLWRSIYKLIFN